MRNKETDRLARLYAELSGETVTDNPEIDILVQQYRKGEISKKALLNLVFELLNK